MQLSPYFKNRKNKEIGSYFPFRINGKLTSRNHLQNCKYNGFHDLKYSF